MKKGILESWKIIIIMVLITGIALSSFSFKANAQEFKGNFTKEETQVLEKVASLEKVATEVNPSEALNFKNLFTKGLENGDISVSVSKERLDLENIKVLKVPAKGKTFTTVTVPIIGENYNFFSNITVVYDSNNNIENHQETLITKSVNNTFEFTSYADGEKVRHEVSNVEYVSNEQLKKELKDLENTSDNLIQRGTGKIVGCLASILGIGSAVGYLIVGACMGSCPAAPPICAACVAGFASLGGASMAAVVKCFSL
ncbi:hypothetical protein [Bacillus cereus]|uniref:Uncharacterized protein n=1 Tax=Bacillus cereus HuA4-10 TaxID=1053206 RepID=J8E6K6_BACCE|nr:hypothetical protein [Bacillus cereus]EJQ86967.1 hypothetical protein IGC_00090 [Bacillus cereus HuA4-10]